MHYRRSIVLIVLAAAALFAFASCSDGDSDPTPTATATAPSEGAEAPEPTAINTDVPEPTGAPSFEGGRVPMVVTIGDGGQALLVDVRTGRHDEGFDRVVFEFIGALPGYRVEYITPPAIVCGSGLPVEVEGAAFLQVSMTPAAAHDDGGVSTFEPQRLRPGLPSILEVVSTCDFEGEMTWVIGLTEEADFAGANLAGPFRVVVNVAHP